MSTPDDTELAIHHIRRIGRLGDLEQVRAVLESRRLELSSRAPRPMPRSATKGQAAATRKLKAPPPQSTLDPAHLQDPAFIRYQKSLEELSRYMKAHGITQRSAVTGPIRSEFDQALAGWIAVKPQYKIAAVARQQGTPAVDNTQPSQPSSNP